MAIIARNLFIGPTFLNIVNSGLVLNLDAGNTNSYPGSGITWTDLSGNGNNATLVNGPTYNSANQGSLIFDGVNDYASTNYVLPVSNFTVICFLKKLTTSGNWQVLWACDSWFAGTGYLCYIDGNSQLILTRAGINSQVVSNISGYNTTNYHCYAATVNSSGIGSLFIDGVNVASSSIALASQVVNPLIISSRYGNGGVGQTDITNNQIATFSVYNRVLTASEILKNFNALRWRFGL